MALIHMTFHACRLCNQKEVANFVKYGPRHYAHLRCLHAALTPDAFEQILRRMPLQQLAGLTNDEVESLGIKDLAFRIFRERGGKL
jgi:hypothetical protein